jgi:hypothetical protein
MPPLSVTVAEVDEAIDLLRAALDEAQQPSTRGVSAAAAAS